MLNSGKCPPQFVFEMLAAQATREFLEAQETAEEIVARIVASFTDIYDVEGLESDLIRSMERILVFIESVEVSDIDLMLMSYIWFQINYEDLVSKRNKKPLFGGLLKGRAKQSDRVYLTAKNFKTYAFALGNGKVALKPDDWDMTTEVEFEPILKPMFPDAFTKAEEE
jgi:hypothetical protein